MKRLLADTGPLLHLHEAGSLSLLPLLGTVIVPPLVLVELSVHAPALWPGSLPDWLKVEPLLPMAQQRAQAWQQAGLLHGGEAEAVALALDCKPDWFLTDDAAARLMAESLGVEAHGSLGVLLWAAGQKLVGKKAAEAALTALESSSLWMSFRVRAQARAALAQIFATS